MLTGRQIREARALLRWGRERLARNASLSMTLIQALESTDGSAWLKDGQEAALRGTFEAAGVEFTADAGEEPGVRLRKGEQPFDEARRSDDGRHDQR